MASIRISANKVGEYWFDVEIAGKRKRALMDTGFTGDAEVAVNKANWDKIKEALTEKGIGGQAMDFQRNPISLKFHLIEGVKMQNIELNQAKECLPELIEQTVTGNEVIITQNGEPIVKLVAIGKPKKRRRFGSARNLIKIHDDFDEPLEDFQEYM